MIRLCHRCGSERHGVTRFCEECATDIMQQRMQNAFRIASIVSRETIEADPDAEALAVAVADLADELAVMR